MLKQKIMLLLAGITMIVLSILNIDIFTELSFTFGMLFLLYMIIFRIRFKKYPDFTKKKKLDEREKLIVYRKNSIVLTTTYILIMIYLQFDDSIKQVNISVMKTLIYQFVVGYIFTMEGFSYILLEKIIKEDV